MNFESTETLIMRIYRDRDSYLQLQFGIPRDVTLEEGRQRERIASLKSHLVPFVIRIRLLILHRIFR